MNRRLLVGQQLDRAVSCACRIVNRFVGIASLCRLGKVVSQGCKLRLYVVLVLFLQHFAYLSMRPHPPRRAQLFVQRLLDQRVRERVVLGTVRHFGDDACSDRLFQRL